MASKLVTSAQTGSCLKLFKNLWLNHESKGKNCVFSPFSLNAALGLLASGSKGRTLQQMLGFLNYETVDHLNSMSSRLIDSIDRRRRNNNNNNGGPKLSFVSGVWVEKSFILKPTFKEIASSIYKAEVEAVDFKTKANEVVHKVNKWVEKETNGLIRNVVPQGSLDDKTRLLLANALYFKGSWENKFDRSMTKNSEFHLLDGSSVQVPFMTSSKSQIVSSYDSFKVLRLLYEPESTNNDHYEENNKLDRFQNRLSMYIILPDKRDGLDDLIEKVSSESNFLDRHFPDEPPSSVGEFRIPKFKISFDFEATRVLKDLGLVLPFNPKEAELTEMVSNNNERIYVSGAYQKCFVEVDEEGTEAAVYTRIRNLGSSRYRPPPIDFVADHPFMFLIRDDHTRTVLFMGHVLNPSVTD